MLNRIDKPYLRDQTIGSIGRNERGRQLHAKMAMAENLYKKKKNFKK